MASVVSIVNRALFLVGDLPIADLAEDSKRARTAAALWEDCRDWVLRDHPWNATTKRAQLAADAVTPLFGAAYQYPWPADAVRIHSVNDEDWVQRVGWWTEGRMILTDWAAPIDVVYGKREEDANVYDAQLRAALAYKLAAELAEPLTHLRGRSAELMAAYESVKTDAAITDGKEADLVENELESNWLSARYR